MSHRFETNRLRCSRMLYLISFIFFFLLCPIFSTSASDLSSIFFDSIQAQKLVASNDPVIKNILKNYAKTTQHSLQTNKSRSSIYSGCSLTQILKDFSYEDGSDSRIASDFAVYWYLTSMNAGFGDTATATSAIKAAKDIIVDWAVNGFRVSGTRISDIATFCNDNEFSGNENVYTQVGLQIGRGIPYYTQAFDIVRHSGMMTKDETMKVQDFIDYINKILVDASEKRFENQNFDCNRFSNHASIQLAAILSIAMVRHDTKTIKQFGFGELAVNGSIGLNFINEVDHAIYDGLTTPLSCYKNGSSTDFFQTSQPARGEVVDRYRAGKAQTFGYIAFSLDHLLLSTEILERSSLTSPEKESLIRAKRKIATALIYYWPYYRTISDDNEQYLDISSIANYPDAEQYAGKLISRGTPTISGQDRLLVPFLRARILTGIPVMQDLSLEFVQHFEDQRIDPRAFLTNIDSLAIFEAVRGIR